MLWIKQINDFSEGVLDFNIYEGKIECHALGKKAFVDSRFNCWLFQLPFLLENIGFGYICFSLIIPIMLISVFGKIKQSYRWFILNQAFWDFFIIYNFICDKPTWNTFFKELYTEDWFKENHPNSVEWLQSVNQRPPTCFYSDNLDQGYSDNWWIKHILSTFFYTAARNATFAPLFLLTFSRFICLYFHYFYENFAVKKLKILLIIIGFNVFYVILVNLDEWYTIVAKMIITEKYEKCVTNFCNGNVSCHYCLSRFYSIVFTPYLKVIQYSLPPLTLIVSNILAIFIIVKIVRQFKYQAKHNRSNLINSLKIACVILFQSLTMTFLFVISFVESSVTLLSEFNIFKYQFISETWPSWLRFLILDSSIQSFNIIRIFLDSCIILSVLTDYHKAVVESVRFCILFVIYPKTTIMQLKKQVLDRKKLESTEINQNSIHSPKKVAPLSVISG